jgi:hypothetical protein
MRIITVWVYENAKQSVVAAVIFHAMGNVAQFLFPNYGSHYDPFVTFVILGLLTIAVVALWGPATLSRFKSPALLR